VHRSCVSSVDNIFFHLQKSYYKKCNVNNLQIIMKLYEVFNMLLVLFFIEKSHAKAGLSILGMGIGTAAAYLFGTVWFLFQAKCSLWYALTVCVFPFLIGDGIKILIAAKIGPMIRRTLQTANLLEQS